jgi:hypothetical protein
MFLPGNGLYIDLDGSTGQAGTMETKLSFGPGTYNLSFDLVGNQRGATPQPVTVSMALGAYSEVFTIPADAPFTTYQRTVVVSSPGTLSFSSAGGSYVGTLLDNVQLEAVPEPAFYQLAGLLALGGLGALRLRKRA